MEISESGIGDTGRHGTTLGFQKNRFVPTRFDKQKSCVADAWSELLNIFTNIVCSAAKLTTEVATTDVLKSAVLDFFTDHVNDNSFPELYDFIFRK